MTNAPGTPTEVCAYVAGPLEIWVGTGAAAALEFLGRSVNGVTFEEQSFTSPIPSDEFGGDQGPPAAYQLFGTQHRISFEMHKFDPAVLAKLDIFYNAVTVAAASLTAGVGMLLDATCGASTFRLLINTTDVTKFVRNYPACFLLDPVEMSPVGSQATRARFTFTSNAKPGGTQWNTTHV